MAEMRRANLNRAIVQKHRQKMVNNNEIARRMFSEQFGESEIKISSHEMNQNFVEDKNMFDGEDKMIYVYSHKNFSIYPKYKQTHSSISHKSISSPFMNNIKIIDEEILQHEWSYAEICGIEYLYKHQDELKPIIGFAHYRDWFDDEILGDNDVILPNRAYVNLMQHYKMCHNHNDLEKVLRIIHKKKPEYDTNIGYAYFRNMFIMKKEDFLFYAEFLLSVLSEFNNMNNLTTDDDVYKYVEKNINEYSNRDIKYQARLQGFLAERISTIFFANHFKNKKIKETHVTMLEKTITNINYSFISFANNMGRYSTNRIIEEAKLTNIFNRITAYSDSDFSEDYRLLCGDRFKQDVRGFGYWSWKPYIIKKELSKLNYGDILVYADAGCKFQLNSCNKLTTIFNILSESEKCFFIPSIREYMENQWSRADLYQYIEQKYNHNKNEIYHTPQIQATVLYIKKTKLSELIIDEWFDICNNHYELINDIKSSIQNEQCFQENRHDQSVLSMLLKSFDCVITSNSFGDFGIDSNNGPILAKRIKDKL